MSNDETITIQYRTQVERPRDDVLGKLFRFLAEHPLFAGLIGGVAAVVYAYLRVPEGVRSAPTTAFLISLFVIGVWMALLFVMRQFFAHQAIRREQVVRRISYDGQTFVWREGERVRRTLEHPSFRLSTHPVPAQHLESEKTSERPWPVWLEVLSESGRFILETKVAAKEAADYPDVAHDVVDETDDRLPTHVASPLLILARHESDADD